MQYIHHKQSLAATMKAALDVANIADNVSITNSNTCTNYMYGDIPLLSIPPALSSTQHSHCSGAYDNMDRWKQNSF